MIRNAELLAAVQAHPVPAVTVMLPVPPLASIDRLAGEIENEQTGVAPLCVTVNVCPAMVRVPLRELVEVFAATENATDPPPLPLPPEVIVRKAALLVAVHVHPAAALTVTLPGPPIEVKD